MPIDNMTAATTGATCRTTRVKDIRAAFNLQLLEMAMVNLKRETHWLQTGTPF